MKENINIAVVGLGYVGLPLSIEFAKLYNTIGFDIDQNRISRLCNGIDDTLEVSKEELKNSNISFTDDLNHIKNFNFYIVTVPTPVDKYNNPDLSILKSASKMIGELISKGDTVVYESTVYPGATEEVCVPILEQFSGMTYNKDFYCGYSPERINPGDKNRSLTKIAKITSGSNEKTALFVDSLYSSILTDAETHLASSISVAEAAKVIENIQRDVNIALINELSMIFKKLNIDTNEVLNAAKTKWNFNYFTPDLIVGGHCIGVDPYYLTHKAIELGFYPEMILAGRKVNESMPSFIANTCVSEMAKNIDPNSAKIAILGLTFKENCPDLRNTKVVNIFYELNKFTDLIQAYDPYAKKSEVKAKFGIDISNIDKITPVDVVVIAVAHDEYKSLS